MSPSPRSAGRTVAAVAIVRGGTVLAGRRVTTGGGPGGWEFPGGGVEPGETPEQAAVREAREELDVDVSVTGHLGTVPISDDLSLTVFTARLVSGEPVSTGSHDGLAWVSADELASLSWLPADRPLLAPLAVHLRAESVHPLKDGRPVGPGWRTRKDERDR